MNAVDLETGSSVFAERRRRLAAALGGGIAVIPTAPERPRNRDTHFPYRYDSYFYYLTGFQEPEAVLVLVGGDAPRAILYCRERNAEREIWDGFRHGPEGARERFAFDEAHAVAELDAQMPALLADRPSLWYPVGADGEWDARIMRWLNAVRAQSRSGVQAPGELHDVRAPLDDMRLVTGAPCSRRARARTSTKWKRNSCTNSGAAARSSPRTGRSSPAAPTPACCTTCRTTRRSPTARCC